MSTFTTKQRAGLAILAILAEGFAVAPARSSQEKQGKELAEVQVFLHRGPERELLAGLRFV